MRRKSVVRRRAARQDIGAISRYYDREAGRDVAVGFLSAVEQAVTFLADRPEAGSPRLSDLLGIAGLRSRPIARFPYLLFYFVAENRIEVARVLHSKSDILNVLKVEFGPDG